MVKKYTVYFEEKITYAVEIEVENALEDKAIVEIARKEMEDTGREHYSVNTSGLTVETIERAE